MIEAKEKSEKASLLSQKLLEEKNDLIGLLSHDMRSPINRVKGLSKLMALSLNDTETLKDYLSKIDQAANEQLELFRNVLAMLKSDQMILNSEPFETVKLHPLFQNLKETLEWDLNNKHITLKLEIPKTLLVNIQIGLFSQALHNLVSNSIKFSQDRQVINIQAENFIDRTVINIQDNGIGFEPSKAERIFDRFTKEGQNGTLNETSTGLGLYLTKKIIENHNGIITAHSDGEGTGALFSIILRTRLNGANIS